MFGQVLDKLDIYFGRTFLFARYVPWLLCLVVNALVAAIEFPRVRETLLAAVTNPLADQAGAFLMVMLAVWVVAFGTSPVIQFATRFLEGSAMPKWLQRVLAIAHAWRRDELDNASGARFQSRADSDKLDSLLEELREARQASTLVMKIREQTAIESAAKAVMALCDARDLIQPIELKDAQDATSLLSRALRINCAETEALPEGKDREWAARLELLYQLMWTKIVPYAKALAETLDQRAAIDRHRHFAAQVLAPTGLGNEAAALKDYCNTRYGIDFDFFWPRFLLVARNDSGVNESLASAKIQLDFSILALTLSFFSVIGWVVLLAWNGTSILTAALIFGLGPLTVYALLGIVHAAYADFADVVRSAIDLRRFDVLIALRQALPLSSSDERRCWDAVQRLALFDEHHSNMTLRHLSS